MREASRRASVASTSTASSRSRVAVGDSESGAGVVEHPGQRRGGVGQPQVGQVLAQPLVERRFRTRTRLDRPGGRGRRAGGHRGVHEVSSTVLAAVWAGERADGGGVGGEVEHLPAAGAASGSPRSRAASARAAGDGGPAGLGPARPPGR